MRLQVPSLRTHSFPLHLKQPTKEINAHVLDNNNSRSIQVLSTSPACVRNSTKLLSNPIGSFSGICVRFGTLGVGIGGTPELSAPINKHVPANKLVLRPGFAPRTVSVVIRPRPVTGPIIKRTNPPRIQVRFIPCLVITKPFTILIPILIPSSVLLILLSSHS